MSDKKAILNCADDLTAAAKARQAADPAYLRFVTARSGPGAEVASVIAAREAAINEHLDDFLEDVVKPLVDRVKALESELAEAKELKYCGTWTHAVYMKNNLVTDKGALWICKSGTDSRPGTSGAWQLAAKGTR